jgi:outer membrane protein assembly factor BamB
VNTPNWGFASHPLIEGRHLYCVVGGDRATVVAFDKKTGKELWSALNAAEPGYSPPMICEFGGERHLVVWDSNHVSGLNLNTGEVHWQVEARATFAMSIGLPQSSGNYLYLMSFNRQTWLVRVADDGRSAKLVWYGTGKQGGGGVMNTPILEDRYAYGCGPDGRYMCSRLADGERIWSTFQPSSGDRPANWANVFTIKHHDRYLLV